MPQKKQYLLDELHNKYKNCLECPSSGFGRNNVVFGAGNADAKVLFIGEGPGAEEDSKNIPFVGKSGKLLNTIFAELEQKRSNFFITNVVKCRPPNNRKPTQLEINTCKNILLEKQIAIISPYVICTLGATALGCITSFTGSLGTLRGKSFIYHNAIVIPTYHPAYILRNQSAYPYLLQDIKRVFEIAQECEK